MTRIFLGIAAMLLGCTTPTPTPTPTPEFEPEPQSIEEPADSESATIPSVQLASAEPATPPTQPLPSTAPAPDPPALDPELAELWQPFALEPLTVAPRLVLTRSDWGVGGCSFDVRGEGLPAVDRTARLVFDLHTLESAGADINDTTLSAIWRDFEGHEQRRIELYDGTKVEAATESGSDPRACRRFKRDTQAQVELIAGELAADDYESLPRLPVQIAAKDHYYLPSPPLSPRGAERPVEALYHGGYFIARVPGLRVLVTREATNWLAESDLGMDSFTPNILALFGDPRSGVVVVEFDHESASCMSDPTVYSDVIVLPPSFFVEVEARGPNARRFIR